MAYTFPKSRRGSYAIPQYVKDEGLERHAFVTLQAPDGTFDNPAVGDGGYVVPKYVLKDPIGQGVRITKRAPRGTYYGPKIPYWLNQTGNVIVKEKPAKGGGTAITMVGLGDVSSSVLPFQKYGNKVASLLLNHVQKLPPTHRKAELKRVMNAIDPSMFDRAAAISSRNVAAGMPLASALHAGIARAAATGMHAELIQLGRTNVAPKARSLLGMGCYGCEAALGALNAAASIGAGTPMIAATQTPGPAVPADGACSADGKYIWHGAWKRLLVGEVCKTVDPNYASPTAGGAQGGTGVDFPLTKGTIKAGPWYFNEPTFNYRNQQFRIKQSDADKIPPEWLVFLKAVTVADKIVDAKGIFAFDPTAQPIAAASYKQWFQLFGGTMPPADPTQGVFQTIKPIWNMLGMLGSMPVATYPIAGKDFPFLVRVSLATRGTNVDGYGGTDYNGPLDLLISTYPPPQGGISLPSWLASLPTEVHAGEIVSAIADLGCQVFGSKGAKSSPDPYVQAGAAAASLLCGQPQPPACPPGSIYDPNTKACVVMPQKSSLLPVAIVGGAALAALVVLHRRSKRKP